MKGVGYLKHLWKCLHIDRQIDFSHGSRHLPAAFFLFVMCLEWIQGDTQKKAVPERYDYSKQGLGLGERMSSQSRLDR